MGTRGLLVSLFGAMTLFLTPVMLLNVFVGIIAGVWLAILGKWWALGYGFGLLVVSTFGRSFLLMLGSVVFGMPGTHLISRRSVVGAVLGYPLALLHSVYTFAAIAVWCVCVFHLYMQYADSRSFIPLLLWSYGTATGPWTYMGSSQRDNAASMISAFAAQMGYIVMLAMALFFQPTLVDLTKGLAVVMLAPLAIEFVSGIAITSAANRSARPIIRPTTLVDSWAAGPTEIQKDRLHTPPKNDFGSSPNIAG
jgi:hypothetical protein